MGLKVEGLTKSHWRMARWLQGTQALPFGAVSGGGGQGKAGGLTPLSGQLIAAGCPRAEGRGNCTLGTGTSWIWPGS